MGTAVCKEERLLPRSAWSRTIFLVPSKQTLWQSKKPPCAAMETRTSRSEWFAVPQLTLFELPHSGERVFSPAAMDKIEAWRAKQFQTA